MKEQDFQTACRFLNALVAAIQRYGVSSSNMESTLARVARALHLQGQFVATPTQVQSIIRDDEDDREQLSISFCKAGSYDLAKLAQLSELGDAVESGKETPAAGLERIRAIDKQDPTYGGWVQAAAFVLCGMGFGVILGLRWNEVFLGGALGVVAFGIASVSTRFASLTTTLEFVVGAVTTASATLLSLVLPGINPLAVAVCASVYFVPGFSLTLGASELMSGNTLSGWIGFIRGVVTVTKLALGALMGHAMIISLVKVPRVSGSHGVPSAWTWLFVPLLVLGLAVLFQVRPKNLVWPVLGALLVWWGVQAGSEMGPWQGTFIGAFLLMSAARFFAWATGRPGVIIQLPVVMVIVPGFAALQAFYEWQAAGPVAGLRAMSDVVVLIGAILGGVLVGEAVWSAKQTAIETLSSLRSGKLPGRR